MADLLTTLLLMLLIIAVGALTLVILLRKPPPALPPDNVGLGAQVAQSLQPALLDFGKQLAALSILQPMKESADQKLPHIEKTTEAVARFLVESNKARAEEEKVVREALSKVHEATKGTPDVQRQLAVLQNELKRLHSVEKGLNELMGVFLNTQGRGKMGEDAIRRLFEALPSDLWSEQFPLSGGKVDFVVYMPNKRILPIDSKTTGVQAVHEYFDLQDKIAASSDPIQKEAMIKDLRKLEAKTRSAILSKAADVAGYIQPEAGTLGIAIQAIPDPVYQILDGKSKKMAADSHVQIVPYSLLHPIIDILRTQNQYETLDFQSVVSAMDGVRLQAEAIRETTTNKFERAQKLIENGIRDVSRSLTLIERNAESVRAEAASTPGVEPKPAVVTIKGDLLG
jgi:hypothetical protein